MNAPAAENNRIIPEIIYLKVSPVAGNARMSPADVNGNCTPQTIRIRGCQVGYSP